MRSRFVALPLAFLAFLVISAASSAGRVDDPFFWIERLEAPDAVVLTRAEIEELNNAIIGKVDQMADIGAMPEAVSGERLRDWLLFDPVPGPDEPRFTPSGERVGDGFFKRLAREVGFDRVLPSNPVTFGVVTERADVRAFPSSRVVIKRPGGFDTFQYSSISPTEPVALLHRSGDNKWGFFQTRSARGWIRLDKVAFTGRDGITPGGRPIVVTGSSLAVYSDAGLRKEAARLPMGAVLHLAEVDGGGPEAPIPVRLPKKSREGLVWATGYIGRGADFSEGFLPYTRRNVIAQAFKMLGEEYGWGGREGLRDCSAFVKDVFASMGVNLPRNSRQQAFAGEIRLGLEGPYGPEDIVRALDKAEPGITLLTMDGHVMLYLGSLDNRPHVIHQIYGYMDGEGLKELKKASVTGLELGAGSKAGTLKDRIRGVSEVRLPSRFEATPAMNPQILPPFEKNLPL